MRLVSPWQPACRSDNPATVAVQNARRPHREDVSVHVGDGQLLRGKAPQYGGVFDCVFRDVDGRHARVEWFLGVGLAYEVEDGEGRRLRVYVEGDEQGRATIVTQEQVEPGAALGPVALGNKIRAHLDSLDEGKFGHEFGGYAPMTVLARWCGIDHGAALRTNRGPPPSWTREQLALLSRRIVERQEAGLNPVDFSTGERWKLKQRQVRALAHEAKRHGFLGIVARPGRRNHYYLPLEPASSELVDQQPETMRRARFEFERKRRELGPRPNVKPSQDLAEPS